MENRYVFYFILLNMLVNVIVYVPNILINYRFEGSVISILLAIPIGTLFLFIFLTSINKFGKMGLPEILYRSMNQWVSRIVLFNTGVMFYWGGSLFVLSFTILTVRYVLPQNTSGQVVAAFLCIIVWATSLKTKTILHALEIFMLVSTPILIWVLYKAFTSKYFTWNSVIEVGTYITEMPNWSTISATSFFFSGYGMLVVFNRVLNEKKSLKWIWFYTAFVTMTMLTTFFIPIGIHGSNGVGDFSFPWMSTADALRMELGAIERVFFLFFLVYIVISLLSVIVQWHVSFELFKSLRQKPLKGKKKVVFEWSILLLFAFTTLFLQIFLNEEKLSQYGKWFLNIRFPVEIASVFLLYWLARRKKN